MEGMYATKSLIQQEKVKICPQRQSVEQRRPRHLDAALRSKQGPLLKGAILK